MNKTIIFFKNSKKLNNKIFNILSVHHTILVISIVIGVFVTAVLGSYADKSQNNIANSLLRLHVIANSDSEFDQNLKIKVRDAIIKEMTPKFKNSNNIRQTKKIALNNTENMTNAAKSVIAENGKNYDIKISLDNSYFPTKYYGDMSFPPGIYEALKVEIGDAKGKNWWCVLFPPLCFVDATNGTVPEHSKERLRQTLSQEEYSLLTSQSEGDLPVKIKFKSVEVWQTSKQKVQVAIKNLF